MTDGNTCTCRGYTAMHKPHPHADRDGSEARAQLEREHERALAAYVPEAMRAASDADMMRSFDVERAVACAEKAEAALAEERALVDRLNRLLGSHADGHRCTCTMLDPGVYHGENMHPPEWEQDPWCPTHPEADYIRQQYEAMSHRAEKAEAALARVEALRESMVWKRPDAPCENAGACCGSDQACDAMLPSFKMIGIDALDAALREPDVEAAS